MLLVLGRGHKLRKEATELDAPASAPVDHQQRPERRLVCAACGHPITSDDARIDVAGQHRHTCVNPAGVVFRIGCFRPAAGMADRGPLVAEHSWFPGYRWQIGVCARCQTHLGWGFRGRDREPFWGLILERLVEQDD